MKTRIYAAPVVKGLKAWWVNVPMRRSCENVLHSKDGKSEVQNNYAMLRDLETKNNDSSAEPKGSNCSIEK